MQNTKTKTTRTVRITTYPAKERFVRGPSDIALTRAMVGWVHYPHPSDGVYAAPGASAAQARLYPGDVIIVRRVFPATANASAHVGLSRWRVGSVGGLTCVIRIQRGEE